MRPSLDGRRHRLPGPAIPAAENPYGNEAVYELEIGVPGVVMETVDAAPASLPLV